MFLTRSTSSLFLCQLSLWLVRLTAFCREVWLSCWLSTALHSNHPSLNYTLHLHCYREQLWRLTLGQIHFVHSINFTPIQSPFQLHSQWGTQDSLLAEQLVSSAIPRTSAVCSILTHAG